MGVLRLAFRCIKNCSACSENSFLRMGQKHIQPLTSEHSFVSSSLPCSFSTGDLKTNRDVQWMFNLKTIPNVHEKKNHKKLELFLMPSMGKMVEISHYYMHKLNTIPNILKVLGESSRGHIIVWSNSSWSLYSQCIKQFTLESISFINTHRQIDFAFSGEVGKISYGA